MSTDKLDQFLGRLRKLGDKDANFFKTFVQDRDGSFVKSGKKVTLEGPEMVLALKINMSDTPPTRQELIQTLDAIVQDFLLGAPRVTTPAKSDRLTVNWVMLEPIKGSGGYTSVFRMIRRLVQSGHEVRAYVEPDNLLVGKSEKEIEGFINQYFFETGARIVKGHEFARSDAIVATAWPTAKIVSHDKGSRKKLYYVQDFEPYFYSMGEEHERAESTYKLGLSHITLGRWLTELLRERYDADADYVDFGLDKEFF